MTDNTLNSFGGKLAPRLAKVMADAVVYATQQLGDHKNGLAQQILADFTNHISDEVQTMFGGVYRTLAEHPDTPPELQPLFHELGFGRGQAIGAVGGSIAGTAASAGLFDFINNLLGPVIHRLIAASPNGLLSPDVAAAAQVRGLSTDGTADSFWLDYLGNGLDRPRFEVLMELALRKLSANQVQDMVNRGLLTEQEGQTELERDAYTPRDALRMVKARKYLVSPPEAAEMVNRSVIGEHEGVEYGARSGVTEDDMLRLIEIVGAPLSPGELAEAFRRGFINEDRWRRGVHQSKLRNEWFDVAINLLYRRMSPVDAADAVNQGHMDLAQAEAIARAEGLDVNDFNVLIQTAGRPPGESIITDALNRGLIDEQTFTTAFLESPIKNKYVQLYLQMRYNLIPQETVRLLYRNGVYPKEKAHRTLMSHGYTSDDADAMLALEVVRQEPHVKDLSRQQITTLYETRNITRDDASAALVGIGYNEATAQTLLDLADIARIQKLTDKAVGKIGAAYAGHHIDRASAGASLDSFGVPPDQQDDLFRIWDIERTTISKQLTLAQLHQAARKGLLTAEQVFARLIQQGYSDGDAGIVLQLIA